MKLLFARPRLVLIATLWIWCMFLVELRSRSTGQPLFANLPWNLFLATVPLAFSTLMQRTARRESKPVLLGLFAFWLLFLPNAPYILTDFFHLRERPSVPLWLDLALISAFAGAGLVFCYLSLSDVQKVVRQLYGSRIAWLVVCGSLMLCAFGIYLGRYLRLNSWYVITHPGHLFHKSLYRLGIDQTLPNVVEVTLVYGVGLIVGYLAMKLFATAVRDGQ